MKKIIFIAVLFVSIMIILENKNNNKEELKNNNYNINDEIRGIYISYIEYQKYFDDKKEDEIKKEINNMINNIYESKFNLIILHVRPFSDAIYDSNIYPYSYTISSKEGEKIFDVLDYFIEKCHDKNIKLYAWINPYRIRNTTDISNISIKNPCYKWLGTNNVHVIKDKGIFYNPASQEVENLVINGVEELIEKYKIDGIHFDDYFYPSDEIDKINYESYLKNGGNLDIKAYRYQIINSLIKKTYEVIKKYDSKLIFSIAPDANIENNYNKNYADIYTWLSSNDYVDMIIPQLYYGFDNTNKPYIRTLIEWNNYIKTENIKLVPALAFYKLGNFDQYAGDGSSEWIKSKNIISNQVKISRNMSNYNGFIIFRYDSFFNDSQIVLSEKEELLKIIDLVN